MAALDPHVAAVVDRDHAQDEDEDALIDELENDDKSFNAFRESRRKQLHSEYKRAQELRANAHGSYSEIKDEKALMDITTSTKLCVVHFSKNDFNRCRIMDGHLETLVKIHLDTRFLRIDVSNAPFLVVKLKVQVLPCVLAFIDGVCVDRIVGFEGLGRENDSFTTRELEARLLRSAVLIRSKVQSDQLAQHNKRTKYEAAANEGNEDDSD
ncbi:MAG: hypothetical protein M1828_001754 [Chrysothrix sp. TS-e1954]|nr:MAG: hypothetical protein M1828_001754 [Chrysothrix sp. TS-e1954]